MGRTTVAAVARERGQAESDGMHRERAAVLGRGVRGELGSTAPRRNDEITRKVTVYAEAEARPARGTPSPRAGRWLLLLGGVATGALFAGILAAGSEQRIVVLVVACVAIGAVIAGCGRLVSALQRAAELAAADRHEARERARALAADRDESVRKIHRAQELLVRAGRELRGRAEELVALEQGGRPARVEDASEMHKNAKALLEVIDELVALAELESSGVELQSAPFDLREALEDVVSSARVGRNGGRVVSVVSRDVPRRVRGDARQVYRVLENLVVHAVERADAGEVLLRVGVCESGEIGITFRGVGPDEGIRRFVSESFARAMGGSLQLSRWREGGAQLELRLPLTIDQAFGPIDVEARARVNGARVVIVDPSAARRLSASELLRRWGASVAQAVQIEEIESMVGLAERDGRPVGLLLLAAEVFRGHPARALGPLSGSPCIITGRRGAKECELPEGARWLERPFGERALLGALRDVLSSDLRTLHRRLHRAWETKERATFRSLASSLEAASLELGATALAQASRRCAELRELPEADGFLRVMDALVQQALPEEESGARAIGGETPLRARSAPASSAR